MNKIIISNEAYDEFKTFLDENKVESYNVRINLAGFGCHGAVFNISIDEKRENDLVEQVKDITFLVDNVLIEEFEGFSLLSTEENDGAGLSLKPQRQKEGGCGSCNGCH